MFRLGQIGQVSLVVLVFLLCGTQPACPATIELLNSHPRQGQTMEVLVSDLESPSTKLKFNNHFYSLFPAPAHIVEAKPKDEALSGGNTKPRYCALLPIAADLPPGKYLLEFGTQQEQVSVQKQNFPVQRLHLPKSKDNFLTSPGEKEAIEKAKSTLSSERLWSAAFKRPSTARISTVFGVRRVVNGRPLKDYFHTGLDFAAALGSPVKAPANGQVILAKTGFRLHGNVVAIDHGQGVISLYVHLQKILVKPNQLVKAGDIIGKVGHSGRANGPHLHFGIYVNQEATNPSDWFQHYY